MYTVIPDNVNKGTMPGMLKKTGEVMNTVLTGSKRSAFGLYDFLILFVVSSTYFFFTGFALLIGRKLPKQWLEIGYTLGQGKITEGLKRTKEKRLRSTKGKGRVVDLERTDSKVDLLNN